MDIVLGDEDGLLAVELLGYDEEILFGGTLFLLFLADKGHILAPALIFLLLVLARELVEVLLTQQHHLLAQCEEELGTFRVAVEFGKLIDECDTRLETVLLEELIDQFLTHTLGLTVVATQDGLYLRLGLCRGDEVDPGRADVL